MDTAVTDPFRGVSLDVRRNSGRYHVLRSHRMWRYEVRYKFPDGARFKPGYESVPSLVGYGRDENAAVQNLLKQLLKLQEANGDMAATYTPVITIRPSDTASTGTVFTFKL